jgi:hypothetical protein
MTGRIDIYHYGVLIYQERFRLWEVEELSWEDKAKTRERQYNSKVARLIKSMPFYDPDITKIYVTYKSKMNGTEKLSDLPEVQEWKGVSQGQ